MRARLSKLNKPFLTFLACVAIAYGMWVLHWVKAAGKELPVALEWVLGDDITDEKRRYKVEAELEQYLTNFVALAELRGIDLSYVYSQNITIVWEVAINNNSTNVATSYGRDSDEIIIVVNKERFMARTEEGKKYVMYHEFGHDILNFRHLEGSDRGMMEPTAYTGFFKSYVRFNQERQRKYLYTSLNTMFERFNNKTIKN